MRRRASNYPALRGAFLRVTHFPFLPHARLQPFADQAIHYSILHPTAQKFLHLPMIDSVEELPQIHLKDPLHFLRKALFSQVFQRLML